MAKYDFSTSRYAKFFGSKDNVNHLRNFINSEGILGTNYGWWKTQGKKASAPTSINPDGTAVFQIGCRSLEAAPLMDMRAPLADSLQDESKGVEFYSATIPHFITRGTVENAMEREYKERMYAEFGGDDAEIVLDYAKTLQKKVDSVDATLTYMTAKLMTTGKIDYRGIAAGIQAAIHDAKVPLENFSKAGVGDTTDKVWTAKDCKILNQMAAIERKYRDKWGTSAEFKWKMSKKMYNEVFLQNAQVKEFIAEYRKLNYIATPDGIRTTDSMFKAASVDLEGLGISPIEIVEEKERNKTLTTDTFIKGWDDNVVVFCPAGDVTEIEWCVPSDQKMFEKYGANSIAKVFARANDGLSTIVNTTLSNGQFREWHTDCFASAVPALNEFLYHVIVDTTTV